MAIHFDLSERADEIFMVGLFSLLDAILDQPLEKVLETVSVTKDVEDALMHESGIYSDALNLVRRYERADWEGVSCLAERARIDESKLPRFYREAVLWANSFAEDTPSTQPAAAL
jgi:c-di-GMP-related signal transduction protein